MARRGKWWWGVVAAVGLGAAPGWARAQYGPVPPAGALGNPAANPYMNPFLNPALMAGPNTMRPGTAALYMFSGQAQFGGLGSGQLSGVRPPRGAPASASASAAASAAPAARDRGEASSSMVPGGNAASYFNRSYQTGSGGASAYYHRQGRYYPKTGR